MYVLRHAELFPNARTDSTFRLLQTDEALRVLRGARLDAQPGRWARTPIHREYRALVDPWFNGAGAERARPLIERYCHEPSSRGSTAAEVEIVSQFARPLPVMVITTLLGFPLEDIPRSSGGRRRGRCRSRAGLSAGAGDVRRRAGRGVPALHLGAPASSGGMEPQDDVLTHLAEATFNDPQSGPRPLTRRRDHQPDRPPLHRRQRDDDFAITSALYLSVQHPEAVARLRASSPSSRPASSTRCCGSSRPPRGCGEASRRDAEVGGVPIAKGSTLHLRYGAANRDPAMFQDPDRLDLDRRNASRHVAFAAGEHGAGRRAD
jgi:cytochrome P450